MPKPKPLGRDLVRVAVYSCVPDAELRTQFAGLGRRYALARYWLIATEACDDDPFVPLEMRPGWAAVRQALACRDIHGVIVAEAGSGTDSRRELHRLDTVVRAMGGFLAKAVAAHPLRHGPGAAPGGAL
ncbi:hypothetical protein ACFXJO_03090 [Streptomyces lavendulae]|uniref:hypothetical protein n=1 Tax=Streptomyces lavendulae TaxID=1914 RepID=UPI0036AF8F39